MGNARLRTETLDFNEVEKRLRAFEDVYHLDTETFFRFCDIDQVPGTIDERDAEEWYDLILDYSFLWNDIQNREKIPKPGGMQENLKTADEGGLFF